MTEEIQKKNIAIAEMMGAKYEPYYKNHTTGFEMAQMVGECMENLRKYSHMPIGSSIKNGIEISNLYFHSSYDWQFEAVEWIENIIVVPEFKITYLVKIEGIGCEIGYYDGKEITVVNVIKENKKEAIFEALYQFSQYIKEKS